MLLLAFQEEEKNSSREKIAVILEADSWRKEKEASKNDLETYILHVRGLLRDYEEQFAVVSKQEERDSIITLANELEEWLYDDGWDEATEVLCNHYYWWCSSSSFSMLPMCIVIIIMSYNSQRNIVLHLS